MPYLDELICKLCAAIILTDKTKLIPLERHEWIGFNLLIRDNELPQPRKVSK